MSDDPTPLTLPTTLPYPIIITRLIPSASSSAIARGTKVLEYSFTSDTSRRALARLDRGIEEGSRRREKGEEEGVGENDMVGSWESPIEGEFVKWGQGVAVGMRLEKRHASRPVIYIQQPCTHPVQLHGLCGICGKELQENDYIIPPPRPITGNVPAPGPSRFPGAYEMGHDSLGVTVSSREAKRIDNQVKTDLLHARKLSLIVDLDQTIIHTTVDPTVGEWLEEIRRAEGSTSPTDAEAENKAEWRRNPNAEALRDVASFQLEDEPTSGQKGKTRSKESERYYFTKPRPGLPTFLEKMSQLYEMHVYTMGTRTYADAICRAIDPEGKIFGGRILSRDESGNIRSKHLKRLFPTDQSMVVVIDDRGDVWGEIPNLVKVIPYEFFDGIGDINSTPSNKGVRTDGKVGGGKSTAASSSKSASTPTSASSDLKKSSSSPLSTSSAATASPTSSADTPLPLTPVSPSPVLVDEAEVAAEADAEAKEERLHQIEVDRPLKRQAEKLQSERGSSAEAEGAAAAAAAKGEEKGESGAAAVDAVGSDGRSEDGGESGTSAGGPVRSTTPDGSPPPPSPILNPNDDELERLTGILSNIHRTFYAAYDDRSPDATDEDPLPMGCDVELIIPDMKSKVLEGCTIVFSGIIPQGVKPEQSDIWLLSLVYGARPLVEPSPQMTHCVCLQPGTEKTHKTQQLGKWVVTLAWMVACLAIWKKVDEGPYDCYPESTKRRALREGKAEVVEGAEEEEVRADKGKGKEVEADVEPPAEEEELDDPDFAVGGWDEEAEKEFEAFLEGSEGGMSERGSIASPPSSIPGTPRKRVRYADEEDLPLTSFRDPPAKRASFDDRADEGGESPERKRKRPLLLGPPSGAGGQEGEVRKLELSKKQKERMRRQVEESRDVGDGGEEEGAGEGGDTGEVERDDQASEAGTEGEDEFARMLAESLDD